MFENSNEILFIFFLDFKSSKKLCTPCIAPFKDSKLGSIVSTVIWNSSFCNMASRRRLYLLRKTNKKSDNHDNCLSFIYSLNSVTKI